MVRFWLCLQVEQYLYVLFHRLLVCGAGAGYGRLYLVRRILEYGDVLLSKAQCDDTLRFGNGHGARDVAREIERLHLRLVRLEFVKYGKQAVVYGKKARAMLLFCGRLYNAVAYELHPSIRTVHNAKAGARQAWVYAYH